ncbi:MAG: hypothetical protein J5U17_11270 [Candidatus Methanoperedens sp.]|nr:hypothetical protein [Candidatus Methanoperedens sp.]MCE8426342.1 hypothetical protein [Candidatus Methanoperedens sp.]MCE8428052.1 hypothetical protein [Candidatus Methanoperedens sp.]
MTIPSKYIDYLCAIDKGCMNCGEKHNQDCPVGLARAQIHSTTDLISEFYKSK